MTDFSWISIYSVYALMAGLMFATAFFLVRAVKSGAVTMGEGPKYQMMNDEAAREGAGRGGDDGAGS